ncbi:MAG: hypothetical protein WBW81_06735 [Methylocella sp.]
MKPIATTISPTFVQMRFADNPDPEQASEWLDFQVPLENLKIMDQAEGHAVGNPNNQCLGDIRRAALRYVQALIADEIRRSLSP